MSPTVAKLIQALPQNEADDETSRLPESLRQSSMRPVPIGRWRRMALLGSLQAQIAAAYAFYWLRGWFASASENNRRLAETHWRTAVRVLDSMGYMRGAEIGRAHV